MRGYMGNDHRFRWLTRFDIEYWLYEHLSETYRSKDEWTDLQEHGEFVGTPRDVYKTIFLCHLRLCADTLLEMHQAVVIVTRFQHPLLVMPFRVLVSFASS